MSDAFRFETFVDVHGSIFNEYLSSVTAKLSREDKEYQALQAKIEGIYEKYPKVLGVFDSETESVHKRLRQVEYRTQAADHPILWAAEESYYLKFYIFQVCEEK